VKASQWGLNVTEARKRYRSLEVRTEIKRTIPANDDHHLPARCGSNRRLDLSGKDNPRKAGLLALSANRLGTERATPCHQQRT